jgi:hypothetical protein
MGRFVAAFSSLIFPGLGHLFYGQLSMAMIWFIAGFFFGPLVNILSGLHIFMTAD